MQTVDYNIRAKLHGRFREQLMHAEMRPVCLIHDQGQAEGVRRLRDHCRIADDPLITGRRDKNRADPAQTLTPVLFQGPPYILSKDRTVQFPLLPGMEIYRLQAVQADCVVSGFMAAPGHQDPSASPAAAGADRRQDAAGTSIYKEMGLFGPIELRRPFLGLQNHALRVVQVVKTVYFRDVKGIRIRQGAQPALVPGHMEGVRAGCPVPDQFFIKIHGLPQNCSCLMPSSSAAPGRTS